MSGSAYQGVSDRLCGGLSPARVLSTSSSTLELLAVDSTCPDVRILPTKRSLGPDGAAHVAAAAQLGSP